jgi:hypothetical protein
VLTGVIVAYSTATFVAMPESTSATAIVEVVAAEEKLVVAVAEAAMLEAIASASTEEGEGSVELVLAEVVTLSETELGPKPTISTPSAPTEDGLALDDVIKLVVVDMRSTSAADGDSEVLVASEDEVMVDERVASMAAAVAVLVTVAMTVSVVLAVTVTVVTKAFESGSESIDSSRA